MPQLLPACLGPVSNYESRKYGTSSVSGIVNGSPECCYIDYKDYVVKEKFCTFPVTPAH